MATKTKAKKTSGDIELSEDKQALIQAIATGNTEGVSLDALHELLDSMGLKGVAKGVQGAKTSRIEKVRRWLTATELDPEEKATIEKLPEIIGKAPIITSEDEVRDFKQPEIDLMVEEMVTLRPTEDIIEGRRQAIRSTTFNLVTLRNGDDPYAVGDLVSTKFNKKLSVTKQVRKGEPNYEALKAVLPDKVWKAIVTEEVTVSYKVDEEKLTQALGEGKVTMEQFASLIPEEKTSRVFSLKDLKEGEAV